MKKDLNSFKRHDSEFNTDLNSIERTWEIIRHYDNINQFKLLGFELAIKMSNPLPKIHIDIGSGNGWLLRKTAPIFDSVYGIEPSSTGINVAKEINRGTSNISYINKDMIDGLAELKPNEPVFITTATVLSHIEDYYVAEFLKVVNQLPINSTLCFDERYDKNIQWNMWHIRSKEWWEEKLPQWQLVFLNFENNSYPSSIFGICVGKENVIKNNRMNVPEKILWKVSKGYYIVERIFEKISNVIKGHAK